jgi:ectoine hydroxylase-related dioxygenase (phytanoyl-CoA dioxygenase family)
MTDSINSSRLPEVTLFKEEKPNAELYEKGFLKWKLFSEDEISALAKSMNPFFEANENKVEYYSFNESSEIKKEIYRKIEPILSPIFNNCFRNYKILSVGLFQKKPGGPRFYLHNHPNAVDESVFNQFTIWIPLTDLDVNDSPLGFIEGSHRMAMDIRPMGYDPSKNIQDHLIKYYIAKNTIARREAYIFNDRTLHYSPPNTGTKVRRAIMVEIVPEEAELCYFTSEEGFLYKYPLTIEKIIEDNKRINPDPSERLEKIPFNEIFYSINDFNHKYLATYPQAKIRKSPNKLAQFIKTRLFR